MKYCYEIGCMVADAGDFVGQTIQSVEGLVKDSEKITFITDAGAEYAMFHEQDCCEAVWLEDIDGDASDLIGAKVLSFVETSKENPDASESGTWTFYTIITDKGRVWLRWNGESDGFYSESVSFYKVLGIYDYD